MNLPNLLTIYRIILSPIFIGLFLTDALWARLVCLLLVISFMVTDYLDGYFARRSNLVSDSGKLLDPLADKVSNFTVFLCFMIQGYAHIWMIAAIFYRDALVNLLRAFGASRNVIIGARKSGKVKTALQGVGMLVILVLLVWEKASLPGAQVSPKVHLWANWIMGAVAIITVLSLADYVKANWGMVKEMC